MNILNISSYYKFLSICGVNNFSPKVAFFEKTLNIVHRFCVEGRSDMNLLVAKLQKQ